MDKIVIKYVFLISFLLGCKEAKNNYSYQSFLKDGYNVVFTGPMYLEFNLKKSSIESLLNNKEIHGEIIIITKQEKEKISNIFFGSNFLQPKGEVRIIGKNLIMPPDDDKIQIYKNNVLISTFIVNRNFESDSFFPSGEEKKVTEFRDIFIEILSKEKQYLLMKDKSLKFLEKEGGLGCRFSPTTRA